MNAISESSLLTGYGLGRSHAVLAAPLLGDFSPSNFISSYTFGAPKVRDQGSKRCFGERFHCTLRIIIFSDPLPYLTVRADQLLHPTVAMCITESGYIERWPASTRMIPQVESGVGKSGPLRYVQMGTRSHQIQEAYSCRIQSVTMDKSIETLC